MKAEVDKIFLSRDIRPTAMRLLIFSLLGDQRKALSLYEIEQHFDNVDRSTIYRTLKTFQDKHLIHKIDDGTGAVKYAVCDDDCTCKIDDLHIHFLCNKCGQTHCLKEVPIPNLNLPEGFDLESANFVVEGICSNCK